MPAKFRRRHNRLRCRAWTPNFTYRAPPEAHAAISVRCEVQVFSIWRPHRIPVRRTIICDNDGLASAGRNNPDITPAACLGHEPVGDKFAVWRPGGLHCIGVRDHPPFTAGNIDYPYFTRIGISRTWQVSSTGRDRQLFSVGRPAWIVAEVSDTTRVLSG